MRHLPKNPQRRNLERNHWEIHGEDIRCS
jgi:hypothetical protein